MRLLIVSTILILASWPTIAGPDYPFPEELTDLQGRAEASLPAEAVRNLSREQLCEALASAAQANDLPVGFFVRLIWQESRFIATAVSRAGAQGVAQFMPAVAAELGLSDPFDPLQALPKSAELLRALRREFGNLGLAAAAYNAGSGRIKSWLERRTKLPQQMRGRARLPNETQHYVVTITGHAPEHWINGPPENVDFAATARVPCRDEIEADQPPQVEMPVRVADASGAVPPPRPHLQAVPPPTPEPPPPSARISARARAALLKPRAPRPEAQRAEAVALKPWGVQLAGSWSETKARETFERLRKKHPVILGKREPQVVRARLAGNGAAKNRIRIALDTRAGAEQLCSALRSAGGACMVMRN